MLPDKDLKIESISPKYPGGQQVQLNGGVRVKHIPSGVAVECWDRRSQSLNVRAAKKGIEAALNELKWKGLGKCQFEMSSVEDERNITICTETATFSGKGDDFSMNVCEEHAKILDSLNV